MRNHKKMEQTRKNKRKKVDKNCPVAKKKQKTCNL